MHQTTVAASIGRAVGGDRAARLDAGHAADPHDAGAVEVGEPVAHQHHAVIVPAFIARPFGLSIVMLRRRRMKRPPMRLPIGVSMSTGHMPGMPAGEGHGVAGAGGFERDIRAGVRGADHEHRPVGELLGSPVVERVELADRRVELRRERRHDREAVRAGGDDDVLGEHLVAVAELEAESAVGEPGERDDPRRRAHRKAEVLRVPLEVVAHLRAGRVREPPDVDAQARQAQEGRGVNRRSER